MTYIITQSGTQKEVDSLNGLSSLSAINTDNCKDLIGLIKTLEPNGKLKLTKVENPEQLQLELMLTGFIDIVVGANSISASKPNYEIGASVPLTEVLINEESLLDETDLIRPTAESLAKPDCSTKKKACKDCSCGRAEELLAAEKSESTVPVSSCGSCYLGDAFRCASCPYAGMPAFKPGEKVKISSAFMKDDI